MTDRHDEPLARALDPEAPPAARGAAREALRADAEGRALLAEHEALWNLLGDLDADETDDAPVAIEDFVRTTVAEATRQDARLRRTRRVRELSPALAASLLVVVGGLVWWSHQALAGERDEDVVRHLHLLEALQVVDSHGEALDLRTEVEIRRAFDGELEER